MPQPTEVLAKRVKELEQHILSLKKELRLMEKRVIEVGTKHQNRQNKKMADLIKSRIAMIGK